MPKTNQPKPNSPAGENSVPPPDACQICWHRKNKDTGKLEAGIYASLPLTLDINGQQYEEICYAAKCCNCGHLRTYITSTGSDPLLSHKTLHPDIYLLEGRRANRNVSKFPVIKKYNINPEAFEQIVLNHPKERYFSLSALPKKKELL